jgi:hypothetical protein
LRNARLEIAQDCLYVFWQLYRQLIEGGESWRTGKASPEVLLCERAKSHKFLSAVGVQKI